MAPPRKKPVEGLEGCVLNANFKKLENIEIKDDFVADLFNEYGIIERFTNAFATYAQLNEEAKEEIRKIDKKVPQTPKKATAQYRTILDELDGFRKLNLNDDECELTAVIPVQKSPSPRKAVVVPDVKKTPKPATPKHVATPRIDQLSKLKTPTFCSSLTSTVSSTAVVPKAANVRKPNPKDIAMKSQIELQMAEERRNELLKSKVEQSKKEREEREQKVRQRKQEEEEKLQKQQALLAEKEKRIKEFEAAQREEANNAKNLALKVPTTPKNVEKKKQIVTPRQKVVPAKKTKETDHVVYESPPPKRKMPAHRKKVEEIEIRQVREEEVFVFVDPEELKPKNNKSGRTTRARGYSDFDMTSFVEHERQSAELFKSVHENSSKLTTPTGKQVGMILAEETETVILPKMNLPKASRNALTDIVVDSPLAAPKEVKDEIMETEEDEDHDTVDHENKENQQECYEMTADKVFIPSTEDNYVVDDLSSNDETDDESNPRKEVPKWAKKENLNPAVREMIKTTTLEERCAYFGRPRQPTLELLFPESNMKDNRHRNSSSKWHSPFSNPRPAKSIRK
uniref:Inner centromere protein ARK-binding domain-containing protein n=1 Tax=Panagrolaimus sp. JU765 TaxID=591449 RepID=A0AC34QMZ8_9BILA